MAERSLYAFVDNSNVLIEGRRFAEMRRKGRSKPSAFKDDSYEIDWGRKHRPRSRRLASAKQ